MKPKNRCPIGKILVITTIVFCAPFLSNSSFARRGVIDFFGPTDVGSTGEAFETDSTSCGVPVGTAPPLPDASCVLDLSNPSNPSSSELPIGFTVQIGLTKYTTAFVNENGILTFGSGLASAFAPESSIASIAGLGLQALVDPTGARPFIAPFYANLTPATGHTPPEVGGFGGVLWGRGHADPAPDPNPDPNQTPSPFSFANAVPAFHVFWVDLTDPLNPIQAEVILYSKDAPGVAAGNFDMRILYGNNPGDRYNLNLIDFPGNPQGLAGFVLGGTPVVLSEPLGASPASLNADSDYLYHFCGGVISASATCTTTPPPPPKRCDVNGDKDVDLDDLLDIAHALRHKASSATDPRDADGNGNINLTDLFLCIQKCTRKYCAVK